MKQEYIKGDDDTVKVIINNSQNEEIVNAKFVFEYDENGKVQKKYSNHIENNEVIVDSLSYKNGLLDVVYNWNKSEQVGEKRVFSFKDVYKFDEKGRKELVYTWNTTSDEVEWVFEGLYCFYYTDNATSIGLNEVFGDISIYPNPTTNYLNIKGYKGAVKIINVTGRIVKEFLVEDSVIDISILSKGVYLLEFENGIIHKFIKKINALIA